MRLYTLGIQIFRFGMWLASAFHTKIRQGWQGRKETFSTLKQHLLPGTRRIWLHAASLGEYEQGLPVLQTLQKQSPNTQIIVSFFSPSGFEVVKRQPTDFILIYLPLDLPTRMHQLVNLIQPSEFYLVKYDFWLNLLSILKRKSVPVYVLSALLYPDQIFFKIWGSYFRQIVGRCVSWFFHQTPASLSLGHSLGWYHGSLSGDTRYDRVRDLRDYAIPSEKMRKLEQFSNIILFGSCWDGEIKVADFLNKNFRLILAPHEMQQVANLQTKFGNACLWSEWQGEDFQILIIDSVGQLSRLYRYAWVAVVGGGFHSKGLHNTLEAAAYGIPVLFGSHYRNHPEADTLVADGGAASFDSPEKMAFFIKNLSPTKREYMANKASEYINRQPKAVDHILLHLKKVPKSS